MAGRPRDQPASALTSVLLPAPLAPTTPTIAPAGTVERHVGEGDAAAVAGGEAPTAEHRGHAERPR